MSAVEDDESAFAHQAELEYRERNACEKCGEPATCMWDDRMFCKEHYDYMTIWEPREETEDDSPDFDLPEAQEDTDNDDL